MNVPYQPMLAMMETSDVVIWKTAVYGSTASTEETFAIFAEKKQVLCSLI